MLQTRVITALLMLAIFIPALFYSSNLIWATGMLLVTVLAGYEWAKLIDVSSIISMLYSGLIAGVGVILIFLMQQNGFHWFFQQSLIAFCVVLLFWGIVVPILMSRIIVIKNKMLMLLIGIILLLPFWMAFVCVKGADPVILLTLLATIWLSDTAAYFSGKQFGKHKLAPAISPGKTWEGVIGALLAVTIFAVILYMVANVHWGIFPLLWVVAILGVFGDLFESLIKRQMNKKDSGQMLPGHGGILDRVDGILPSLPIAILSVYLFHFYQLGI